MTKKTKITRGSIVCIIIFAVVAIGVIILLSLLFQDRETHTSSEGNFQSISSLYCASSEPLNPFFNDDNALTEKHEVKIIFIEEKPDKISYTYAGTFPDELLADQAKANFHAKFNINLGENDLQINALSNTFASLDDTVSVNLLGEKKQLNDATGKFFFLSENEVANYSNYSHNTFAKIYESRNFKCKYEK